MTPVNDLESAGSSSGKPGPAQSSRTKWTIFGALLLGLLLVVAVIALAGGNDKGGDLTVERFVIPGSQQAELLISVSRSINVPETAKNGSTVRLRCNDGKGRMVLGGTIEWPFIEEANYPLPHYHQPAAEADLRKIAVCRVTGTTKPLEGRMQLRN